MHKRWVYRSNSKQYLINMKESILITYRTYNPTMEFSKYELNNKLLGDVTFFFFLKL